MAIEFSGEYRIPATQRRVWDALGDPAVLRACISGCSRLEKISDSEMVATVVAAVGPISATFKGDVMLSSLSAPIGYTLTGQGGLAGLATMQAQVALAEDQGHTVLKYIVNAEVGGQLESVGGWLAPTLAKINADDFFAAFARYLSATSVPEAVLARAAPETGAPVPVTMPPTHGWLVVFAAGLGFALGYLLARLL